MEKGDQTGVGGIVIGFGLAMGTFFWPWAIPDETKHILFWISAFCVLGGALWLLDLHLFSGWRKLVRLCIPILSLIFFFTLAGYIEWPKAKVVPNDRNAVASNPLDQTIGLECDYVSKLTYDGQSTVSILIYAGPQVGDGEATETFYSNTSPKIPSPNPQEKSFERCKIINYGPQPVANIQAELEVHALKSVKAKNGFTEGPLIGTTHLATPRAFYIGTAPDNVSEIFVFNFSPYFMEVFLPPKIMAQQVGRPEWQSPTLIPAMFGGFELPPSPGDMFTNPSASVSPSLKQK